MKKCLLITICCFTKSRHALDYYHPVLQDEEFARLQYKKYSSLLQRLESGEHDKLQFVAAGLATRSTRPAAWRGPARLSRPCWMVDWIHIAFSFRCSTIITIFFLLQILKFLKHGNVRGLRVASFELEVVGYTIALAYCIHKGLPFSAYGELAFLLIQGLYLT